MRVVGGTAKGRKLEAVPGSGTRPILDRVKTALFDILRPELGDSIILDLFAGSGSVGIEALSQGASRCTFIDNSAKAIQTIHNNLIKTDLSSQASVYRSDAFVFLQRATQPYDLVYIAPPQYQQIWIKALKAMDNHSQLIKENGFVIVQIDPKEYANIELSNLAETRQKRYGSTMLVFYQKN